LAGGLTTYWPGGKPVTPQSRFDIGSVTKAVVTTSLFARGVDRNRYDLSAPVSGYVKSLAGNPLGDLILGDVLNHSSGLVGWYPIYSELGKATLLDWMKAHAGSLLKNPPRAKSEYSDIGFLILGMILEADKPLARLFDDEVRGPLRLSDGLGYGPLKEVADVVATEYDETSGQPLQGVVFDENCRKLGGECSHAGLFATAESLAPWAREWLRAVGGGSAWLTPATARRFTQPAGSVPGSTWGYGWDTKSPQHSSAGKLFSPKSFGHLGYPGASVWIDPEREGFTVLLTNRVHPSRFDERIRQLRPLLHDAVVNWWENENE